MNSYQEERFKEKVQKALEKVRTILHNARAPQYAPEVAHSYDDKYLLAEFLTNAALASTLSGLEVLGIDDDVLKKAQQWGQSRSVTLRLKAEERCSFVKETTRKVENDTQVVTEYSNSLGMKGKKTDKVVTKVTEYFWKFEFDYELFLYKGNDPNEKISLQTNRGELELVTTTKDSPKPQVNVRDAIEVNLSWLVSRLSERLQLAFSIDRTKKSCHTPRRNDEVAAALDFYGNLYAWAAKVQSYFRNQLFPVHKDHGIDLSVLSVDNVFVPVIPLFEDRNAVLCLEGSDNVSEEQKNCGSQLVLLGDLDAFLGEQKRSLGEKLDAVAKVFGEDGKIVTRTSGLIMLLSQYLQSVAVYYNDGVDDIEQMLRNQLIAAIGKVIGPVEFSNYMVFHNRKLFREEFEPAPFCYAIRRPDHYPEGTLTIEADMNDGNIPQPIYAITRKLESAVPMKFSINAATKVSFGGDRYLHAWMNHQFSGSTACNLNLLARARQFSCFVMMVGRIVSVDLFEPVAAIIIQNKDDLKIPLILEQIPTPKAFRDAIESLSPEQQRFCQAFRSMQLESTLFGICIIQIKPQLEKLLKLPDDSLTKEIQLTQHLLELFIQYQIPSDLLSYDGDESAPVEVKVNRVKSLVKAMQEMINKSKDDQLKEEKEKAMYEALSSTTSSSLPSTSTISPKRAVIRKEKRSVATRKSSAKPSSSISTGVSKPAPPADTVPQQPQTTEQKPDSKPDGGESIPSTEVVGAEVDEDVFDFTALPRTLDSRFETLDEDAAVRATIVKAGPAWHKKFQKSLLSKQEETNLSPDDQTHERNRAFDLLDALSRSGVLLVDHASLHVMFAATHCFDKTLINTLVQDNVNPIEKVERSCLIMATTIHEKDAAALVKPDQLERVSTYSPTLFTSQP